MVGVRIIQLTQQRANYLLEAVATINKRALSRGELKEQFYQICVGDHDSPGWLNVR